MKRSTRYLHSALALLTLWPLSSAPAQEKKKPDLYLDATQPVAARVDDLVSRMTLEEKIAQMQNAAPAIPRLHIAAYDWWNEGLHGVARSGYATVFPQAIGLAATWDTNLIRQVADTISTEARAKFNQAQREGNDSIFYGLTLWSPNINIDRDPRWGRGQETYGEDPFLTGQIGASFVEGLQGNDRRYLKTVATPKHFAVHSGPESERHTFDAVVSPYDLADTYLPAFRKLIVDAHAASIMCAYNAVDGSPACASDLLLGQLLRGKWHFNGYVVSDCAAITDVAQGHKFSPDLAHASARSVLAGTDLSCGKEYLALGDSVHQGLISEAAIDASVRRLFTARFRLGMFDPPAEVPFSSIPFSENDSPAHGDLALHTAERAMVLLKNDKAMLPLASATPSIAVVGPNAAALAALEGNYNAIASHPVTPLAALERRMPGRIRYAQGSPYVDGLPVPVPQTYLSGSSYPPQPGLLAEYFNGSGFTGAPVIRRIDRQIDFDWNGAAPVPGLSAQEFSVRWSGTFTPPAAGEIRFNFSLAHCSTCGDNESIELWLDGTPAYTFHHDATRGRHAPTPPFTLTFADTKPHSLRVEYVHRSPHFGAGITFNWNPPVEALLDAAVAAARASDVVIAFIGLSPELEGEEMPVEVKGFHGGDRTSIELPSAQQKLLARLADTGKPLILVLLNGSALALQESTERARAILEAWYPGEAGGTAIANTLFGDSNPSGRLPVTFYAATTQLPPFTDYSMKDRTYRYFTGEPLYPFGFGLSYTRFKYSDGRLSTSVLKAGQALSVGARIENVGDRDGEEVVQVYLVPRKLVGPRKALVGFERITLRKGQSTRVSIQLDPRQLSIATPVGSRIVRAGDYDLYLGGGEPPSEDGITLPLRIVGSATVEP